VRDTCSQGNASRQLAVVMTLGGGAAPALPLAAEGASSIRVAKKNARCSGICGFVVGPGPEGLGEMAELRRLSVPGGRQEEKVRCFATAHTRHFKISRRPRAVDEHRAPRPCSYFMEQVASDVAISKHRPLFTQYSDPKRP
jgi:hypothetical protein